MGAVANPKIKIKIVERTFAEFIRFYAQRII